MRKFLLTSTLMATCIWLVNGCPGNEPQLDPAVAVGGGAGAGQAGPGGASAGGGTAGSGGDGDVCGDGMQTGTEACDDNNVVPGDGCRADCTVEACGDGIVDAGMTCFGTPVAYTAPAAVVPLLADLDGDGLLDLVLSGESLSRRLATAPGVFGASVEISSQDAGVALGHADGASGDTRLDLLASSREDGGVYLNDGNGTFPSFTLKGMLMMSPRVAAGDMDEDGNDDLVVTGCDDVAGCSNGQSNLHVYLSQGDGTLANPLTSGGHSSARTVVADVTGDDRLDVLALNFNDGGSVGFYAGNGDGTVVGQVRSTVPNNCVLEHLDVGDVDGDGAPDVVVGSSCNALPIHVMLGDGTGLFGDAISLSTEGANTRAVRLADLDNDGDLDVVAGTDASTVVFYAGDGNGGFSDGVPVLTLAGGDIAFDIADLNDDGARDIVATQSTGAVSVIFADP